MDESAFLTAADATLERIGLALDAALETSDADLDWSLRDGVLTIECDGASRVIVNRHVPNREIWVAAKSGGFHFRSVDGQWRDTRGDEELGVALTRLLKVQAHIAVRMPDLPAPAAG
ncbi:MAG: iron donor protein CyaY [Betaproteobacteria bacterium]